MLLLTMILTRILSLLVILRLFHCSVDETVRKLSLVIEELEVKFVAHRHRVPTKTDDEEKKLIAKLKGEAQMLRANSKRFMATASKSADLALPLAIGGKIVMLAGKKGPKTPADLKTDAEALAKATEDVATDVNKAADLSIISKILRDIGMLVPPDLKTDSEALAKAIKDVATDVNKAADLLIIAKMNLDIDMLVLLNNRTQINQSLGKVDNSLPTLSKIALDVDLHNLTESRSNANQSMDKIKYDSLGKILLTVTIQVNQNQRTQSINYIATIKHEPMEKLADKIEDIAFPAMKPMKKIKKARIKTHNAVVVKDQCTALAGTITRMVELASFIKMRNDRHMDLSKKTEDILNDAMKIIRGILPAQMAPILTALTTNVRKSLSDFFKNDPMASLNPIFDEFKKSSVSLPAACTSAPSAIPVNLVQNLMNYKICNLNSTVKVAPETTSIYQSIWTIECLAQKYIKDTKKVKTFPKAIFEGTVTDAGNFTQEIKEILVRAKNSDCFEMDKKKYLSKTDINKTMLCSPRSPPDDWPEILKSLILDMTITMCIKKAPESSGSSGTGGSGSSSKTSVDCSAGLKTYTETELSLLYKEIHKRNIDDKLQIFKQIFEALQQYSLDRSKSSPKYKGTLHCGVLSGTALREMDTVVFDIVGAAKNIKPEDKTKLGKLKDLLLPENIEESFHLIKDVIKLAQQSNAPKPVLDQKLFEKLIFDVYGVKTDDPKSDVGLSSAQKKRYGLFLGLAKMIKDKVPPNTPFPGDCFMTVSALSEVDFEKSFGALLDLIYDDKISIQDILKIDLKTQKLEDDINKLNLDALTLTMPATIIPRGKPAKKSTVLKPGTSNTSSVSENPKNCKPGPDLGSYNIVDLSGNPIKGIQIFESMFPGDHKFSADAPKYLQINAAVRSLACRSSYTSSVANMTKYSTTKIAKDKLTLADYKAGFLDYLRYMSSKSTDANCIIPNVNKDEDVISFLKNVKALDCINSIDSLA